MYRMFYNATSFFFAAISPRPASVWCHLLSCRTPPGILCLGHCKLLRAGKGPRALRQQNSTSEIDGSDDRGRQNLSKPTKIENTQKCIKICLIESCKQLSQKLKTPYENAQNKQFFRTNAFLRASSRMPSRGHACNSSLLPVRQAPEWTGRLF